MKTNWPSKLIFKFTRDGKLISNLLIYIVLLAKLKNNFTIGPLTTDENGEIRITHKIMKEAIENAKADYPMDYSGTLDDCMGVEVIVETMNELRSRFNRGREFYPKEAAILEELTRKCSNSKYTGKRVVYKQTINSELIEVKL